MILLKLPLNSFIIFRYRYSPTSILKYNQSTPTEQNVLISSTFSSWESLSPVEFLVVVMLLNELAYLQVVFMAIYLFVHSFLIDRFLFVFVSK